MSRTLTLLAVAALLTAGCPSEELEDDDGSVALACEERPRCETAYCEQVLIPEGEFIRGTDDPPPDDSYWPSGDARPAHPVHLDAFCIDKYEVSLERYEECVDHGACSPDGLEHDERDVVTTVNHYPDYCWPDRGQCVEYAVNAKTRWQAEAYCSWVGGRLCTEAEWERAANGPGGQSRPHPWGDAAPTADLVNIPSVGSGYVDPVDWHEEGQSVEGVLNLAGNVYEWVEDEYDLYEPDPSGEPLHNPVNRPDSANDDMIGRGSCFFTEPHETVNQRSLFPMDFDWG